MASRYEDRGDTPTITRRRHVLTCARCRARRVKCDRAQPVCSTCFKAGAVCQPAQQAAPSPTSLPSRSSNREPTDQGRLSKLEEQVARLSREVDSNSPSRESSLPASPEDTNDVRGHEIRGKIVSGPEKSYLSPFSWAVISEEVAGIDTLLGRSSRDPGVPVSTTPGVSSNEDHGPLPDEQLHETLLKIFSHRVDPLIRLLHWPSFLQRASTLRERISSQIHAVPVPQYPDRYLSGLSFNASQQGICYDTRILPPQSQTLYTGPGRAASSDSPIIALLYSVYYAAVVSVIDSPNPPDLGQNISAFRLASTFKREVTNRVMSLREGVARFESLELLQAMVLNLSVEPVSSDLQLQWLQLGAAIHMAQGLGVHHDGSNFGLSPIEIEVRRRVWAQICILDVRFAEQLCREPTIVKDSYDTALPLSICDRDLTEIDEQDTASGRGQESDFKTHQEIEQGQERHLPFSPMTFALVEAETARLMLQILVSRCRARDSIFHTSASSPQPMRRGTESPAARSNKTHWVDRLESRFQSVYRLNSLDSSNAMQFLVFELIGINVAKAKFVTRLIEWREDYGMVGDPQRDGQTTRLFREAVGLATRTLALIHRYTNSPYSWYTKRLREVYTSSFLAMNLASGQHMDQEDTNSAWLVLDQLFPVDAAGQMVEHGISESLLGKVISRARTMRAQALREQEMHAAAGSSHRSFSTSVASYATVTLPTSVGGVGVLQSSGDLFEDFDAIMQDPLWSSGSGGMNNSYGSWV